MFALLLEPKVFALERCKGNTVIRGLVCTELDNFRLPPPRYASQELHKWMYDLQELLKQAERLQRLQGVREERLRAELVAKVSEGASYCAARSNVMMLPGCTLGFCGALPFCSANACTLVLGVQAGLSVHA